MNTDYQGHPVPDNEPPDKEILVWSISPTYDGEADETWCRSYQQAMQLAKEVVEMQMDGLGIEEEDALENGITIKIKLCKTTVAYYDELLNAEV